MAGGLTAALAMLLFASTALASSHNPTGEYAQFKECPLNRATITDCVYSVTSGGAFTLGKKTVPIVNPVTLQGGFEGEGEGIKFYGAENGDTLSKTPQPVPGGLLGITAPTWWPKFLQDWFNNKINEGLTGVNATVELTGPTKGLTNVKLNTENLLERTGTALGLPVKFHLENSILGSNCYIGSNSSPVQIDFTTGTSGSLEGAVGTISFNPAFTILTVSGGKLVNGTFAAPGANGCGGIFSFFIDPLVNSIIGLPSASGKNNATLEGKLQDALAEFVKASE
ncbi:MAG TPA: hypothetical protein VFX45_12210 [Solirubrobacterales bacterium]|nr:hypothetical protein [Solirubrobacterales bacterium]